MGSSVIWISKKRESKKEVDAKLKGESKDTDPDDPHRNSLVEHLELLVFYSIGILIEPFEFFPCLTPHDDNKDQKKNGNSSQTVADEAQLISWQAFITEPPKVYVIVKTTLYSIII